MQYLIVGLILLAIVFAAGVYLHGKVMADLEAEITDVKKWAQAEIGQAKRDILAGLGKL